MPSKFFAIATEGETTDGREITAQQIQDMADTYDPKKVYGARVWLEHFRGIFPDGPFRAYGDVIEVKAEKVDGKLKLFGKIDPTSDLKAMNQARQKIYTSIEMAPNFAKSGKAYLMGLAVTDSPASLGTEMLAFSTTAKDNPLAARKLEADNLFSAAQPADIEWENDPERPDESATFFSKVKALLAGSQKTAADEQAKFSDDIKAAVTAIAESQANIMKSFAQLTVDAKAIELLSTQLNTLNANVTQQRTDFDSLKTELSKTPGNPSHRPSSSGDQGDYVRTDC